MRKVQYLKTYNGNRDIDLSYFVEWQPILWVPPVKWLLGDPKRFVGKRVLELGCGRGRMSCLFGLLGAEVLGVELEGRSLTEAWAEADRWNLQHQVAFVNYDGNPSNIPGHDYDYVFTKTVLVRVPELETFLSALSQKLSPGAELMLVENLSGGYLTYLARRYIRRRKKDYLDQFFGVDEDFLASLRYLFRVIEFKKYINLIIAIRGQNRR